MIKLPLGGLTAVAMILVAEVLFVTHTEPLTGLPYLQPTADDAMLVAKRNLLPKAAGRVMLVGDSSCFFGLKPSIIQEECGYEVVNLGTAAYFATVGYASIVEEALAQKTPPAAIVVVLYPDTLARNAKDCRDVELIGRYLIAYGRRSPYYKPTWHERWSWFARKHQFNILAPEFCGSFDRFAATVAAEDGFFPESNVYQGTPNARQEFVIDPYSMQPLRDLAASARRHDVPVAFWMSPVPKDAVSSHHVVQQTDFLRTLSEDVPHLIALQTEPPVLDPSSFSSRTHVTPTGAVGNSKSLGAAIRSVLQNHVVEPGTAVNRRRQTQF